MIAEAPQFFLNRLGRRLFTVLHRPAQSTAGDGRRRAVVCCAPLFEEKLWSHRVIVNFARFLAQRGIGVVRFDYFGDGESEGLFEEASVATRMADIADAVTFCRQQLAPDEVYLHGLTYGATLAIATASEADPVTGVVAWQPVMDGSRYITDLLRAHLTAQLVTHRKVVHDRDALVAQIQTGQTVNVEGYEIGKALYDEMIALDLSRLLARSRVPTLVQQVGPAEAVERQYASLQTSPPAGVQFQIARELRFWQQQKSVFPPCASLFASAAEWISAQRQA